MNIVIRKLSWYRRLRRGCHVNAAAFAAATAFLTGQMLISAVPMARADIGELGPPPTLQEVERTLTDLYLRGKPLGSEVHVTFEGPIRVGPPKPHDVPGRQLCPTCAGFSIVSTPAYPVLAIVNVGVKYGLASSALNPDDEPTYATTFAGVNCQGGRDCAYTFYRNQTGDWIVV